MAINSAELLRRILPDNPGTGSTGPGVSRRGSDFRGILDSTGGSGVPGGGDPSKAAEAELIRLRMMSDAIALQATDREAFGSPSLPANLELLRRLASYQENSARAATVPEGTVSPPLPEVSAPQASDPQTTPKSIEEIIDRASRRYEVEPRLIRAVIKAESNFNPKAVSPAGARGLMQLMPGTARDLGVTDSFDPEQNVMAGTRYLRRMLNRYDGDLDAALAAYNWGPGNVDRKGRSLPRETRNYLSTVKGYYSAFTG